MTSKEVGIPSQKLIKTSKLPEAFSRVIDLEGWARSIVYKDKYTEPTPDFLSTMLAMQAITAETMEEVWRSQGVRGLQETLADSPGATTGPIEITDLYVAASDFESGQPCYVILTYTDLELGTETKVTTGATNVQATLIGLLKFGQFPIRCQLKRGDSKDKGGRYLIFVLPPD